LKSLEFIEVFACGGGSMMIAVNDMSAVRLMVRGCLLLRVQEVTGIGTRDDCM
jgi:hypothetical protein